MQLRVDKVDDGPRGFGISSVACDGSVVRVPGGLC
jgi:hypothetical protein